jgi:hypothetical protein
MMFSEQGIIKARRKEIIDNNMSVKNMKKGNHVKTFSIFLSPIFLS